MPKTCKTCGSFVGVMRPDGGEQVNFKRPCYKAKTKNRVELHVRLGHRQVRVFVGYGLGGGSWICLDLLFKS